MSPELEKMARRAALPISVDFRGYNHQARRAGARDHFEISWPGRWRPLFIFRDTAEAASRAYFDLVSTLDPGISSRVPGSTAADPVSLPPSEAS
jgi:hypothetical protein